MLTYLRLIGSSLWPFVKSIAAIYLTQWGANLLRIAAEAVAEAERELASEDGWTGAERREWAARQLRQNRWTIGQAIPDYVINLAVELAVARLRQE